MKRDRISRKSLCLFLLLVFSLFARRGAALKEYYQLSKSVRSLGMGGSYYALSDDQYALFYNPAGLSFFQGESSLMLGATSQLSLGGLSAIDSVRNSTQGTSDVGTVISRVSDALVGKPLYANVGLFPFYLSKKRSVGLLFADTKAQFGLLGRGFDSSFDVTVISDSGLFLGYGDNLFENLSVGVNGKMIYRLAGRTAYSILEIAQEGSQIRFDPQGLGGAGGGMDIDLGAIYSISSLPFRSVEEIRLSSSVTNLIASELTFKRVGNPPKLARYLSLGSLIKFRGWEGFDHFYLLLDIADIGLGGQSDPDLGGRGGSLWKKVNWGVESSIHGWAMPRFGFHQGNLTLGMGVDFKYFKADFAWYLEELGSGVDRIGSRRLALQIILGWSAPSRPVPLPARPATPEEIRQKQEEEEVKELRDALKSSPFVEPGKKEKQ